jgi:hypothetical protein
MIVVNSITVLFWSSALPPNNMHLMTLPQKVMQAHVMMQSSLSS